MHKGICKQSNLSLPRSAIPCLSENFYKRKELQALRCSDRRSGSYAIFTGGGGVAAQQLATTQASPKSCLWNHQANGWGTACKTQDLLIPSPFPRKERTPYNKEESGGINYAQEWLKTGVSSTAVFPEQGSNIWASYRVQEVWEDDGSSQFCVRPGDVRAFLLPLSVPSLL